jgi:hypothetical protein
MNCILIVIVIFSGTVLHFAWYSIPRLLDLCTPVNSCRALKPTEGFDRTPFLRLYYTFITLITPLLFLYYPYYSLIIPLLYPYYIHTALHIWWQVSSLSNICIYIHILCLFIHSCKYEHINTYIYTYIYIYGDRLVILTNALLCFVLFLLLL